jgi:DNA-binding response OmpR family regulator
MKTILIIEDDEKIALALTVRLKSHGYTTWLAGDGIMAIAVAVRERPDLILMDIALPGANGFTLVEQLRELPETRETPVILTTASQDPELRKKAFALGTSGLLRKPFDAEELASTIQKVFGRPDKGDSSTSCRAGDGSTGSKPQTAKRILIVEDDQKIAMSLALRMKAAGLEATVANDALSGIRSAVSCRPDLVLLDISLPAGNGFSVAEGIQTNIPIPTPIIFLTASKLPQLRSRAFKLGAAGFFEKPYDPEILLAAVKRALALADRTSACVRT